MKIPKSVSATGHNKGKTIRNNIQGVLSKKYGGLDTKHIFDGIADIDIEKNIPVAETTIQTNVDRGFLDKNKLAKLPNLRDGFANPCRGGQRHESCGNKGEGCGVYGKQ